MDALLGRWMGWSWEAGIIFGLALSVASTVVLLCALEMIAEIERLGSAAIS